MSQQKISVYIVDDHQIMVDGIKALLKSNTKFEVIGHNTSPKTALLEIEKLNPAILITDINMAEMSGIDLAKQIKVNYPGIKMLALSMHGDRNTISDMLEAGINGYVLKNTGMEELSNALTRISNGQMFFSEDVTNEMMKAISEPKQSDQKEQVNLTPREIEIVKLISQEFSNAQIGEKLFISERTVETHRKNIFRKTNTKSVAGLIKLAIEQKII